MNPQQLCDDIVKKAFDFFGGVPLADDITVVVAEIGKEWTKRVGTKDQQEPIRVEKELPELNLAPLNSAQVLPGPTSLPQVSELPAFTSPIQDIVTNPESASNLIVQNAADPLPAFMDPVFVEQASAPAPETSPVALTKARPQSVGKYKLKLPNAV